VKVAGPDGVTAAAARGVVAAMAMSGMRELTTSLGLVRRPPPDEIADEAAPQLFDRLAVDRDAALELAHWGYGAAMGAAYAFMPVRLRRRAWLGPGYGLATWVFFERVVAPVLRLAPPAERPRAERAAIALDHLLYGAIVGRSPLPGERRRQLLA
jgi:hypothetical protein